MAFNKIVLFLLFVILFQGCNGVQLGPPDASFNDPINSASNPPSGDGGSGDGSGDGSGGGSNKILLFNGLGISTSDWQSTEQILKSQNYDYTLVNSEALNAMSVDAIASYGLMIFPGGSGGQITNGLTSATRIRVRDSVRDRGVSYIGFCAGAWVAVGPEPSPGSAAAYGVAIATGNLLDLYLPGGLEPTAAIVDVSFPNGAHRDMVWWGGPFTPEWNNGVIARYETGEPAISQTWAGKGLVMITGPHPESPESWRLTAGYDSDGVDFDVVINMINGALAHTPLPVF